MNTIGTLLDAKSQGGKIWSILPNQTVRDALEMMKARDIGCILVMEDDELCGVLSERDYARKMILVGKASASTLVSDIMTRDVICATRENTVDESMALMSHHDFRHLPVKDGNRVVGMVSIRDLIASVIKDQQDTIEHLQQYIAS